PPWFAVVLGERANIPAERREQILREALRRRPGDFRVLMQLGSVSGSVEGEGWYRAALALRPGNPGAWNNLGNALKDGGHLDGAIDFADLCGLPSQRRYVQSVRLFQGAFAAAPALAANLYADNRYNAACYAVLAAAGRDVEMTTFGVDEWSHLTDLAYRWLR